MIFNVVHRPPVGLHQQGCSALQHVLQRASQFGPAHITSPITLRTKLATRAEGGQTVGGKREREREGGGERKREGEERKGGGGGGGGEREREGGERKGGGEGERERKGGGEGERERGMA